MQRAIKDPPRRPRPLLRDWTHGLDEQTQYACHALFGLLSEDLRQDGIDFAIANEDTLLRSQFLDSFGDYLLDQGRLSDYQQLEDAPRARWLRSSMPRALSLEVGDDAGTGYGSSSVTRLRLFSSLTGWVRTSLLDCLQPRLHPLFHVEELRIKVGWNLFGHTGGGKNIHQLQTGGERPQCAGIGQYLEIEFGRRNVFIDVDMHAGARFPLVLEERLAACKVMLALIGPQWASIKMKMALAV